MATPARTCVGCRTKRDQPLLVRFVRHDDVWTIDGPKRTDGRGVYLCGPQCAKAVIKNRRYPGLGAFANTHYEHQDRHMND